MASPKNWKRWKEKERQWEDTPYVWKHKERTQYVRIIKTSPQAPEGGDYMISVTTKGGNPKAPDPMYFSNKNAARKMAVRWMKKHP
jgi:hypothetical protein